MDIFNLSRLEAKGSLGEIVDSAEGAVDAHCGPGCKGHAAFGCERGVRVLEGPDLAVHVAAQRGGWGGGVPFVGKVKLKPWPSMV